MWNVLKRPDKALKQGDISVHTGMWKKKTFRGDRVEKQGSPHNLNITPVWKTSKMWKGGLTQISR